MHTFQWLSQIFFDFRFSRRKSQIPRNCQKPFLFRKFSSKHVSVWCQKKPFAPFLDTQERKFEVLSKEMSV